MRQFVLAITGPAGSGKSTVAAKLAKQTDSCVNIDADRVKHFVVNPFDYEKRPEGIKQWELLGENIGMIAKNFLNSGFNVIINGYLNEPAWYEIQEHISLTHKVLLLPSLNEIVARDSERDDTSKLGAEAIKVHYKYFSTDPYFADFVKIDSTKHLVEETVADISKILQST